MVTSSGGQGIVVRVRDCFTSILGEKRTTECVARGDKTLETNVSTPLEIPHLTLVPPPNPPPSLILLDPPNSSSNMQNNMAGYGTPTEWLVLLNYQGKFQE